jgi:aspartate kinase
MDIKVAKFGGTSLADSNQFRKVHSIIKADSARRYIVPSAFGKRSPEDTKITDLLYLCYAHVEKGLSFHDIYNIFEKRCLEMVEELNININLRPYLNEIKDKIACGASADYVASRGEYISGLILADLLDYDFIDASEVILFDKKGQLDLEGTDKALKDRLSRHTHAVIPGFYGATIEGEIKTFSRGGSDITGSIVARVADASVYENWTDVSGLLMTDPSIIKNPKPIERVSYQELRELAYMGATVIHDEAIRPVREVGIPINIRNTNEPDNPGTLIVKNHCDRYLGDITGIAGRRGFTVISIEKNFMNSKISFVSKVLSILDSNGITFERLPSGIDMMSIVISSSSLENNLETIIDEIKRQCKPDDITVHQDMALIATVGQGMAYTPGMASRIFSSLYKSGVNIRMIDQGSSEINIIVGVENHDFQRAINAIYYEFVS